MGIQINGQNDSVTASDGSLRIGGNVSIPGVLTYEDVTSVDSVGIVTAQAGIHVTGGNVSVGHNNPSHKLDVVGNTQLYGTLVVGDNTDISPTANGAGQLHIDANGYTPYIAADGTAMYIGHNSAARDLILQIDETDRLVIDGATGNVGVGTNNPDRALSVSDQTNGNLARFIGPTNNLFIMNDRSGIIDLNSSGTGDHLCLGTQNIERLRITSAGNVGIGESTPDVRLHVKEQFDTAYSLTSVTTDSNHLLKLENPSTTANAFAGMQFRVGSGADLYFGAIQQSVNHGDFFFANQNSPQREMMRIKSTGLVGIGTDNPGNVLHLQKNGGDAILELQNSGNGNHSGIFFVRESSGGVNKGAANIHVESNTSGSGSALVFGTGSNISATGSERLRIDHNGKVGIGSTIPTQALDVAGRITKTEYEPGEIIERICAVCDGSTHVVKSGSYTMSNVTAAQSGTTSDTVCSGSQISYKCPAGAKRIHYEYWFKWEAVERSGISHFFIEVDDADVVPSQRTFATNFSRYSTTYYHHGEGWYCMNWVFECDADSTDTDEGQYDSWASSEQTKVIRTKFREYTNSYEIILHSNNYWDGSTASGTNHDPIKPMLIITTTA